MGNLKTSPLMTFACHIFSLFFVKIGMYIPIYFYVLWIVRYMDEVVTGDTYRMDEHKLRRHSVGVDLRAARFTLGVGFHTEIPDGNLLVQMKNTVIIKNVLIQNAVARKTSCEKNTKVSNMHFWNKNHFRFLVAHTQISSTNMSMGVVSCVLVGKLCWSNNNILYTNESRKKWDSVRATYIRWLKIR